MADLFIFMFDIYNIIMYMNGMVCNGVSKGKYRDINGMLSKILAN